MKLIINSRNGRIELDDQPVHPTLSDLALQRRDFLIRKMTQAAANGTLEQERVDALVEALNGFDSAQIHDAYSVWGGY